MSASMSASAPTRRRTRHRGRTLQRTRLADAVGVLLAGDLAPRLLDNFDHHEFALASRVSRRWRTAAVRLEPRRLRDFMLTKPMPFKVDQLFRRLDAFDDYISQSMEGYREIDDPVTRIFQLYENSVEAHIVDAGTSSAASYVAFIEHIVGGVSPGRVLIVAVQDELDKWNAAFQGKTYFCGDLDANPLHGDERDDPDSGLLVSVCSEACVRRHSSSVVDHEWKILVVDAGAARASDMCGMFEGEPLLLEIDSNACHIFSRSQHVSGEEAAPRGVFARPTAYFLDLEEAVFRLKLRSRRLLRPSTTDHEQAPHDDANASPTSIGSVVDERVTVTPMPLPSPSHRATARAPRVHFAPTEETNS